MQRARAGAIRELIEEMHVPTKPNEKSDAAKAAEKAEAAKQAAAAKAAEKAEGEDQAPAPDAKYKPIGKVRVIADGKTSRVLEDDRRRWKEAK